MGIFDFLFGKAKPAKGGRSGAKPAAPAVKPKAKRKLPVINVERRFKLHNRVGQGSMSKVWRATDSVSGRQVCLKVLDKPKLKALKARFPGLVRPDEGEIALTLDHPNIVKTYEYGLTTKGEEFLAMEYIEGNGFNFLVESRSRELVGNELPLLIQMAEGLDYFHRKGYIHRDVCPRNAMVSNDGVLKLIDFGLAVPDTPEFRRPGNRTGTANYMAPELIKRSPTDLRIDVYSFGVTAYEAFTGSLPWESVQSFEAIMQHLNKPPRDPKEVMPAMRDEIRDMLMKGIDRDPNRRFQNMRQFINVLRSLNGEDLGAAK